MQLIYYSITNNIEKFMTKIDHDAIKLNAKMITFEPYILVIPTTGFGEIPKEVKIFLNQKNNQKNLKGIIGSGNKNWGTNYCKAAMDISKVLSVDLLMCFELSGNSHDVKKFNQIMRSIDA